MSRIKRNWILIIIGIVVLVVAYANYKIDLYTFFCEEESNAPACFVLYKELGHTGDHSKASRYLKISCDLKYELACKELEKNETTNSK